MSADNSPSPSPAPPLNDGEFLLQLLQNHHNNHRPHPPHSHLSLDPAVAAVGPTIPIPSSSRHHHPHHHRHHHSDLSSIPPFSSSPQNPNPNPNPNFLGFPQNWPRHHSPSPPNHSTASFFASPLHDLDRYRNQQLGLDGDKGFIRNYNNAPGLGFQLDAELNKERDLGFGLGGRARNGFDSDRKIDHRVGWSHHGSPDQRRGCVPGPPPGFSGGHRRRSVSEFSGGSNVNVWGELTCSPNGYSNNHSGGSSSSSNKDHERDMRVSSRDDSIKKNNGVGIGLSGQLDHPGFPTGSAFHSVLAPEEKSSLNSRLHLVNNGVSHDDIDDLSEQLVDSLLEENGSSEKNDSSAKKKYFRDKDFRSDARGKWILSQRMRNARRLIECRRDIDKLNANFLDIYRSLIPKGEEKAKQKQLLTLLENLVCKEWPNARLFVYGSCANSFGVSKSDIDICLALDDRDIIDKSDVLLKLADILQSDNLQNVQALTRARVPIVKLMDPGTGISCDICINNVLAVVNTKLLRDYAEIDVRLRQLAFLVKHWAKSRGVNETYQGTLSSYAYVLMCIHFLQQRNPPILPCLQGMEPTYAVTVDDIRCTFFDQVEKLHDFGSRNRESISQLLWAFFNYWAYCHDYANSVISIRTGSTISKHEKDWTRRIGNDRHLICIEDPFETSHDLGRVVDKHSIRVLREEFERAAEIMQYDPNPCVALFDPYVPLS